MKMFSLVVSSVLLAAACGGDDGGGGGGGGGDLTQLLGTWVTPCTDKGGGVWQIDELAFSNGDESVDFLETDYSDAACTADPVEASSFTATVEYAADSPDLDGAQQVRITAGSEVFNTIVFVDTSVSPVSLRLGDDDTCEAECTENDFPTALDTVVYLKQ